MNVPVARTSLNTLTLTQVKTHLERLIARGRAS